MSNAASPLGRVAEVLRRAGLSVELRGPEDLSVSGASSDSRSVAPGQLFLAWHGTAQDCHDFVREAAEKGAVASVVERYVDADLPQLRVDDGRRAAAIAAHFLAGRPSENLRIAAVTGTNGKTTTALLARQVTGTREPSAALGTLGITGPDGGVVPGSAGLTTPGPVEVSGALATLVRDGVTTVFLEASSHALEQRRLDGLTLRAAAFTNLTRDHLDYHATFSAYRQAKARLLDLVAEDGGVVVNGLDAAWSDLPPIRSRLVVTRIEGAGAPGTPPAAGERLPDLVAEEVSLTGEGSRFRVVWGEGTASVSLALLGRFNVENALSALGLGLLLGIGLEDAAEALSQAAPATGRLEVVRRDPVPVVVDYAHTPHALERVLETLRPLYSGRLIVVFGAGGDRDREKRPEMGRVAEAGADLAIVTSDNPRTEDPESIVDDILAGMTGSAHERIPDRRAAIARALEVARPGDAVLLAGKGHETYQEVGTERRPFDERVVVSRILDGAPD